MPIGVKWRWMEPTDYEKVLVIANEQSQRQSLSRSLQGKSYEIIETGTDNAIELVVAQTPDLVILDLAPKLPIEQDLALCPKIKAAAGAEVPVIVISGGFSSSALRAHGLGAGADACLVEPVGAEELLAQVSGLLRLRRAEAERRRSEERFRLATEAMDGLVYEWNVSGHVTRRSVGMAQFLGWRPEEVPEDADWWPSQIHPDDVQAVHDRFADAVAHGAADCRQEYRIRHKDGHYVWIWDSNRIVYGADGQPERVIGCAVSVDERKRAESELHQAKIELARLNQGLEVKVEERTARLLETVAELESWSYSIAHDMRAPLRTMHGFGHFLLQEYGPKLDKVGRDYIMRIDAAARRLDDYLRDLLDYGKMGRGDFPLKQVDTEAVLKDILSVYPNLQPPHCSVEISKELPAVLANESALTQVFSNLLGNAVKFVKPGTRPMVKVWAEQKDGWAVLCVEDNGIGIDKTLQERLFNLFQRLHPASEYEGTGIGLAIVRRAVERMGGTVGVESDANRGSRFWFRLRVA